MAVTVAFPAITNALKLQKKKKKKKKTTANVIKWSALDHQLSVLGFYLFTAF
jgi:hypothetical protein